jgi:hypothetical protein
VCYCYLGCCFNLFFKTFFYLWMMNHKPICFGRLDLDWFLNPISRFLLLRKQKFVEEQYFCLENFCFMPNLWVLLWVRATSTENMRVVPPKNARLSRLETIASQIFIHSSILLSLANFSLGSWQLPTVISGTRLLLLYRWLRNTVKTNFLFR